MSVARKRHILKALTWRVVATFTTGFLTWIVSGSLEFGLKVGVLDVVIKLVLYYAHERVWYRSDFGIKKEEEA